MKISDDRFCTKGLFIVSVKLRRFLTERINLYVICYCKQQLTLIKNRSTKNSSLLFSISDTNQGKNLFIRNTWIDGTWGNEECSIGYQFTPGSPFSLVIRKEGDRFSIWVDGQLCGEFRYRGDVLLLNALYIYGDIDVSCVYMKTKIDDKYFIEKDSNKIKSL